MHIQFLGATGTVTGSKYLLDTGQARILVDCGLFQGFKQLRLRNRAPLPVAPADIDAVILTHAHLDHSGYLPLLVRDGFRGKVYCSAATRDLCGLLLPDSGRLLEEEAAYANRKQYSKHSPALPLYTEDDARKALRHLVPVPFLAEFEPAAGMRARMLTAGHMLGAAIVQVEAGGRRVTFSGDLGRPNDDILLPPALVDDTDYLLIESTYANRRHDPADPKLKLGAVIRETAARGGVTIIPAFAVGRAQALMYEIHLMKESGAIPASLPVYLNSPMAADATAIYREHRNLHRLSSSECQAMCHAAHIVNSPEESIALNQRRTPMVIIAASGMATGGRVLHHLRAFAPDARNTIMFAGFQAGGTRGAAMVGGAKEVKIFGEFVPVRAQIEQIENLSAHADGDELMAWMRHLRKPPRAVFVTHGEQEAADTLRFRIQQELGWNAVVPGHGDLLELA
ncbi:MAG: MBL fold metallo-hydrolase RNA specificity domain-containing protein [Telluria sp.]